MTTTTTKIHCPHVVVTFNNDKTTANIGVTSRIIGTNQMEVEPFSLGDFPLEMASEFKEYTRYKGESAALFSDRIEIFQWARIAKELKNQSYRNMETAMIRIRNQTPQAAKNLSQYIDYVAVNLARFSFPPPLDPPDVPPGVELRLSPKDMTDAVLGISKKIKEVVVGIKIREPTYEEMVDMFGTMYAEHTIRILQHGEAVQRNAPQPDTDLGWSGKRRTRKVNPGRKQKPKLNKKFIVGNENDDDDDEDEEPLAELKKLSIKTKESLAIIETLEKSESEAKSPPDSFQKADLGDAITDADFIDGIKNMGRQADQISDRTLPEGANVDITISAYKKLIANIIRVPFRSTPIKRALVQRAVAALLILGTGGYALSYFHLLTIDGQELIKKQIDESKAIIDNGLETLFGGLEDLTEAEQILPIIQKELSKLQDKLIILAGMKPEDAEIELENILTSLSKGYKFLAEVPQGPAKKKSLEWLTSTISQTEKSVESVIKFVNKQHDIGQESLVLTSSLSVNVEIVRATIFSSRVTISSGIRKISEAQEKLTAARLTAETSVRSITWAEKMVEFILRFIPEIEFMDVRPWAAGFLTVLTSPLQAFEIASKLRNYGDIQVVRQTYDLVWTSLQMAADMWVAITTTRLYQLFSGFSPTSLSQAIKKKFSDRRDDEHIMVTTDELLRRIDSHDSAELQGNASWFLRISAYAKTMWRFSIPAIQTSGFMLSGMAHMMSFISLFHTAVLASTNVSIPGPVTVLMVSTPFIFTFFGKRTISEYIASIAKHGSAIPSSFAKLAKSAMLPDPHLRSFSYFVEGFTPTSLAGFISLPIEFAALYGLIKFSTLIGAAYPINLLFHLIMSEQLGEYTLAFFRFLAIELECLRQADAAYDAAIEIASKKNKPPLTIDELLEHQETIRNKCLEIFQKARDRYGKETSAEFVAGLEKYGNLAREKK